MPRILLIDDEPQIRAMLTQMLTRAGYEVTEAANGNDGVRRFREAPADLVITDLIMPGKDGIETILELRREFPDVKIIAVSGGGRIGAQEYLWMARSLGAAVTLDKPVERQKLLDEVRTLIGEAAPPQPH
jgi:DNA-binding response OmpR family regulator